MFDRWNEIELVDKDVELRRITDIVPQKSDENLIVGYDIESIQFEEGEQEDVTPRPTTEFLASLGGNPKHLVVVDGNAVRTVSSLYTPVQDSSVHRMVSQVLEKSDIGIDDYQILKMGPYKTLGKLTLDKNMDIFGNGDLFDYSFVWQNSLDGSSGIRFGAMWIRIICTNGLMQVHKDIERGLVHVQSERNPDILVEKCEGLVRSIVGKKEAEIKMFQSMIDSEITLDRIIWVLKKLGATQKETKELIKHGLMSEWKEGKLKSIARIPVSIAFEEVVVFSETEWGFFNALTEICQRARNMEREISIMRRAMNLIIKSRYAVEMEAMLIQ